MLADVFRNMNLLLAFITQTFLVDKVLAPKPGEYTDVSHRKVTLYILVAITWVCFIIIHVLDYRQLTWKVGGGSRAMLQANLVRRFLSYSKESLASLVPGDIVMGVVKDSVDVVHVGYIRFLDMLQFIGLLLCIGCYSVYHSPVFGMAAFVAHPIVLFTVLKLRQKLTAETIEERSRSEIMLIGNAVSVASTYKLIADFRLHSRVISLWETKIKKYNQAFVNAALVLCNNNYVSDHLNRFVVISYTLYGASELILESKTHTLGEFIANLGALHLIGSYWSKIYEQLNEMLTAAPALVRIANLMNKPTELTLRMHFNRKRRATTSELRSQLKQQGVTGNMVDMLDIIVDRFQFAPHMRNWSNKLCIGQGKLVCLIGPHGQGKSSLLKFISTATLPPQNYTGMLFISSHLRTLHMSNDPMFFHGTLEENLTCGTRPGDADGARARVVQICELLGMPRRVISLMDSTEYDWESKFGIPELHLLNFARALIANPELLCLHKPTCFFNEGRSQKVMAAMKAFVIGKGVCQDHSKIHLRRPRTCIYTTVRPKFIEHADDIVYVDESGARKVSPEDLKEMDTANQSWSALSGQVRKAAEDAQTCCSK